MRKKLVNQKRDELKQLSHRALVNHIVDYPNQTLLNFSRDEDDELVKRPKPIGHIANTIKSDNYNMSEAQYYTLVHHFAAITVPEMKVVGITFYDNDPSAFKKDMIAQSKNGTCKTYEMDYHLEPEPTNQYDKNAVKILVEDDAGTKHHIGYISRDFVAEHPIVKPMVIEGTMVDYSNGNFSNVSYRLAMDTEQLDTNYKLETGQTTDDLLDFSEAVTHLPCELSEHADLGK